MVGETDFTRTLYAFSSKTALSESQGSYYQLACGRIARVHSVDTEKRCVCSFSDCRYIGVTTDEKYRGRIPISGLQQYYATIPITMDFRADSGDSDSPPPLESPPVAGAADGDVALEPPGDLLPVAGVDGAPGEGGLVAAVQADGVELLDLLALGDQGSHHPERVP